jgi:hypothetical protein
MSAEIMPRIRSAPRRFYVALSGIIAVIVFVGFWPTYFGPLVAGTVEKPPVIHIHATVYVGWLALFITQTVFAATGRRALHVKLGRIGIAYGVLVILMGIVVSFSMFAMRVRAGLLEEATLSLMGPLVDMVVLAPLFAAAVYLRRKPELHKRLMIVATTALLIAAVGRMRVFGSPLNPWLLDLVWVSPILIAAGYDLLKRRGLHPIYAGGIILLVVEVHWRREARLTETWSDICAWFATFFV